MKGINKWLSAFGPGPLLAESSQVLLLLPNREVRIFGIPFPISLLNKGNGVVCGEGLCADPLTLLQSPTGFDRVLRVRGKPGLFLWRRRRFSAFRPDPLLAESSQDLLLLPNGEVRIFRVSFTISLPDESNGIVGGASVRADHLTLLQSPTGLDGILRMRRKPKMILIDMIERD